MVGGVALVNALTSESTGPGPAPSMTVHPSQEPESPPETTSASAPPLEIRVVGQPTSVFVKESGSRGAVLQRGVLATGETRRYDTAPLDVVVTNSASVEVRIYGTLQEDVDGGRGEWVVPIR
ncbi:hypothetical protein DFJ69_2521 [Thermomonospora umbrina]|uniref:DUF4115 domain-containing protein n=1 Tax=Thermomonospora umbrina TaxID=111806 RepID=A0A3D9SVP9_9ACTN|nr:hypothetical protein DFJ69_2521 [Thermomonospora umbrina]